MFCVFLLLCQRSSHPAEYPTSFLQLSSVPFQVSALMTSSLATFPLLSYLSGWLSSQYIARSLPVPFLIFIYLDSLNKTKEQIQILLRFYFPHYNCNSLQFSSLIHTRLETLLPLLPVLEYLAFSCVRITYFYSLQPRSFRYFLPPLPHILPCQNISCH